MKHFILSISLTIGRHKSSLKNQSQDDDAKQKKILESKRT